MCPVKTQSELALLGGTKAINCDVADIFDWPIITAEDEQAVLDVLRAGKMSGLDVTMQFESEFAKWIGAEYAVSAPNGTTSILEAMFGAGVGVGDEIIAPSLTFWASILQVYSLGGTVVFAEVEPESMCIDPNDIEHRISDRTKAILAVHYAGHPADMDPIMAIAEKHNLKVIEDVSHAHGALYKGRMTGTIGHVAAMSLMSGKSLATGEGGILVTNDRHIYERAIMFGHYARHEVPGMFSDKHLHENRGLPWGGFKSRLNQTVAAMGRVQLKHYPARMAEIDNAMNYFYDQLDDIDALAGHRPPKDSGSTNGGWYSPVIHYRPEQLDGLSATRFCQALRAEGCTGAHPGANVPLHLHPVFNTIDIYGHGKPTRIANSTRDLTQPPGSLPVTESLPARMIRSGWFKHFRKDIIDEHVLAHRKVVANYKALLADDPGDGQLGGWHLSSF